MLAAGWMVLQEIRFAVTVLLVNGWWQSLVLGPEHPYAFGGDPDGYPGGDWQNLPWAGADAGDDLQAVAGGRSFVKKHPLG